MDGRAPVTIVSGASRGIGLALARRFAEAGDSVLLIARNSGPLEKAARSINTEFPAKAFCLALDVTDERAPAAIAAHLEAHALYADCLVNSAGVGLSGAFAEQEPAEIDHLLSLNMAALTRLTRFFLPGMLARGGGGILNMASLGGYAPGPYQAVYYASKAYVVSFTEAIAAEVAGRGVRIAVVAPGPVETSFHAAMGSDSALYRRIVPGSSAERVARIAYRSFKLGRRVIVPGVFETVLAYALRVLPHPVTMPLIRLLLRTGARAEKPDNNSRRLES